jgi:glycosyltransferase involved in cell wall biosynthesis
VSTQRLSLLFVNQFYHPDVAATGQHLTDLAEFLASRGHSVRVLAALAPYATREAKADTTREVRNGVSIRRFRSTAFGRATHLGRIVDYLFFYLQVAAAIVFGPRYDGVVYLTTPPLIPIIGATAHALRGQRYGIWSMDLHPAAEEAAGMWRGDSAIGRLLRSLWRASLQRADFVVALGPYMRERLVADGAPAARTAIVPPWSARPDAAAGDGRASLRDRLRLGSELVVMYSGNAGLVHDFSAICEAMRILRDDDRFFFLFVGSGPQRTAIEAFAREQQLKQFAYQDYVGREDVSASLMAGDVHLISLQPIFAGISVPSKLYGIMAARRPALFVGPRECESAETILRADAGAVVDPREGSAGQKVAELLVRWREDPAERERLGANAQTAFLRDYETRLNCERVEAVLQSHWAA